MKARLGLGLLLVLHGLAHIAIGTGVQDAPYHGVAGWLPARVSVVLGTLLFLLVTPGFVAAGLGVWNVPGLRRIWPALVKTCVLASFLLFALAAPPAGQLMVGLFLDLAVLAFSDILGADTEPRRRTT